jgi:hypothetical protein
MARRGLSVVIPFGGRERLAQLGCALEWLRRCDAVEQIILSEAGGEPVALDLARRHEVDHLFTLNPGPFDKVRAVNAGNLLARGAEILWLDADLLFEGGFVARALREFRERRLDFMLPFDRIHYLSEQHTADVLATTRHPAQEAPVRTLRPLAGGAPGGMGMVRADFIRRHGGMIEGFRGWGHEDNAWLHKVSLLGRIGVTNQPDQRAWHLFHPDSGSHSNQSGLAAMRSNPSYAENLALWSRIHAISDAAELTRQFPQPRHAPTPWPAGAQIAFAVAGSADTAAAKLARGWAKRLNGLYGMEVPILLRDPAATSACWSGIGADAIVAFVDGDPGCAALTALRDQIAIIVPGEAKPGLVKSPGDGCQLIFAQTRQQAARWRSRGFDVFHRSWGKTEAGTGAPAPPVVSPLSHLLGNPRTWGVKIVLDRAALPPPALDRPLFWYVGFHDAAGAEVARVDADRRELMRRTRDDGPIVIERRVSAFRPPVSWTVWPTDRHGRWLHRIEGAVNGVRLI